jgi:hypothetical protein
VAIAVGPSILTLRPRLIAVAAHLDRMKKLEVSATEMFKVERAAALDVPGSAFYRAKAET